MGWGDTARVLSTGILCIHMKSLVDNKWVDMGNNCINDREPLSLDPVSIVPFPTPTKLVLFLYSKRLNRDPVNPFVFCITCK
jgi:hypothetical protein